MTPATLSAPPLAPRAIVSVVAYSSLTDCQRAIWRLRDLFEPIYSLTPEYLDGSWHIKYTERP
jgi:hypothetical protein